MAQLPLRQHEKMDQVENVVEQELELLAIHVNAEKHAASYSTEIG
jgi:hypothetical protein